MTHPYDIDYIKKLIPFMTDEVSKRIQSLPSGYCYTFGSAFKLPMIVKLDLPNPTPISNSVDIQKVWF